jgi:hypothetical protein
VLWEARRGYNWTDPQVWDQIMDQIRQIETRDTGLRAELALRRRLERTTRQTRLTPRIRRRPRCMSRTRGA